MRLDRGLLYHFFVSRVKEVAEIHYGELPCCCTLVNKGALCRFWSTQTAKAVSTRLHFQLCKNKSTYLTVA